MASLITQPDLLCKKGCGFYGNPQWEGYCSKCWRDQITAQTKTASDSGSVSSGTSGSPATAGSEFRKFESKTNRRKKSYTLKTMLSRSPTTPTEPPAPRLPLAPTGKVRRELSPESRAARDRFHEFVRQLSPRSDRDVIKAHLQRIMFKSHHEPSDAFANVVNEMYRVLEERMGTDSPALSEVEQYICTRLHGAIFQSAEDESQDLALQSRIRSLHWAIQGFIESGLRLTIDSVREHFNTAIGVMVEMTNCRTPGEKLEKVVACSQALMKAIQASKDNPASADDFLPALIFLLLKSNPPLLQSNINFISRFAYPGRLLTGEQAYYFTNLCCAVHFIKDLSAESLKIPQEDFEGYMSGKIAPPPSNLCEGFEPLERLLTLRDTLIGLENRQENFERDLKAFYAGFQAECRDLRAQILDAKTKYPVRIPKVLQIDSDLSPDKVGKLPEPLIPTKTVEAEE